MKKLYTLKVEIDDAGEPLDWNEVERELPVFLARVIEREWPIVVYWVKSLRKLKEELE